MSYLERLKAIEQREAKKENKQSLPSLDAVSKEDSRAKQAKDAQEATPSVSRYAHPWPDEIPGLGCRHVEAYASCANCGDGTWAFYGPWPLCLRCANLGRER